MTESMLRDMVETSLTVEELGDLLTMGGFELEELLEVEGEKVLDVNVMANRGDGASVLGLAREILAKDVGARPTELYRRLSEGNPLEDESDGEAARMAAVRIETDACTRYSCRVFQGLKNGSAPDWIQARLRRVGQRPISLLVDLSNYVMLETGQPTHAFDLDKLATARQGQAQIVIRLARKGERLTTLDGEERELSANHMVICDGERPVALAGIMGGQDTEVDDSTTRCLLESAHFDHQSVRRTRKQLGMQTDASYRFERYVDPEGAVRALNRFAELLAEAAGVAHVNGVVDEYPIKPVRPQVRIRPERARRLLGVPVTDEQALQCLQSVGCKIVQSTDDPAVVPPTWRIDLVREDDLIEEIGRIHGYEKIPEEHPIGSTPLGGVHGFYALVDRARAAMVESGLVECVSHSLVAPSPLDAPAARTSVRNPHSPDMALLRNSLLPSLCEAALRNGAKGVHLFEVGKVFADGEERTNLAALSVGELDPATWVKGERPEADFFSLKGVVGHLADRLGACWDWRPAAKADARFHPTRFAEVGDAGLAGQIHPVVAEDCGLPPSTVMFELDLQGLDNESLAKAHYRPVHRNPAARRDIAVVIKKSVAYTEVARAIEQACGEVLEKQWLFDVYEGPGMAPDEHSLAIALQFRKAGNFTDEEANLVRDAAVRALESLGARLR